MQQVLVPVPVDVMAVLFPTPWWISRRVRGKTISVTMEASDDHIHTHRQMNMDYSICNALSYRTKGLRKGLVIYDIGCEWIINFLRRLLQSNHMTLDSALEILVAVGKFHLNAHVLNCFVKFSLNFMEGAGQIDGEILETLWSAFNKIAGSARTMTKAGRREVYDDFLRDTNFKKLVGIGKFPLLFLTPDLTNFPKVGTLVRKHKQAITGLQETQFSYESMTESMDEDKLKVWRSEEARAMKARGKAMQIFQVRTDKGTASTASMTPILRILLLAPSMADIRLTLTEKEAEVGLGTGTIACLAMGIHLEDAQCVHCSQCLGNTTDDLSAEPPYNMMCRG